MAAHRFVVTGSRDVEGKAWEYLAGRITEQVHAWRTADPFATMLHGDAKGVDQYAALVAERVGLHAQACAVSSEAWRQSRGAGIQRNIQMIDDGTDVVGFWNGTSRGTKQAIAYAWKQGKLRRVYYPHGLTWDAGRDTWDPIAAGLGLSLSLPDHFAEANSARAYRNRHLDRADLSTVLYANDRARDAYIQLTEPDFRLNEVVAVMGVDDRDHLGWYRFRSRSRGKHGVVHATHPEAKMCTCEGWSGRVQQRQPCWHMHAVWMVNFIRDVLLPRDYPAAVAERQAA